MYPIELEGKNCVIFGVANHRSIAWSIAHILNKAGARICLAYQNEMNKNIQLETRYIHYYLMRC